MLLEPLHVLLPNLCHGIMILFRCSAKGEVHVTSSLLYFCGSFCCIIHAGYYTSHGTLDLFNETVRYHCCKSWCVMHYNRFMHILADTFILLGNRVAYFISSFQVCSAIYKYTDRTLSIFVMQHIRTLLHPPTPISG